MGILCQVGNTSLMPGLLAFEALRGPRLDFRPGLGNLRQTCLAPRQFPRDRHAIGNVRLGPLPLP